jgi:transcription antitermination factor NusG
MQRDLWRVLHVVTNHEKRVAEHLVARSIEHYLPLYTQRSKWTDRVVSLDRPLFTGYMFVRFTPEARLSVISIPKVLHLLGETVRDTVSETEIARIRAGLASGCILRPHPNLALGVSVRVLRGAFEGVEGVIAEFRQQCKVVLSLSAIRQYFSLEVDLDDIEILRKPAGAKLPGSERRLIPIGV